MLGAMLSTSRVSWLKRSVSGTVGALLFAALLGGCAAPSGQPVADAGPRPRAAQPEPDAALVVGDALPAPEDASAPPAADGGLARAYAEAELPITDAGFVHTDRGILVDGEGHPLYLRGVNLGNWLVWEGYLMMGDFAYRTHSQLLASLATAFGSGERAAAFERQWRVSYVDDAAIGALADLGYNAVRAPFNYKLFFRDGALVDDGFSFIDALVAACRAHGVYVLLDMHGAPGYQNPGDHSDNANSRAAQPRSSVGFWDGDNVDTAARVWRHIASHYAHEPVIWGYDLLNEPVPQAGREYELLPSLVRLTQAVREVDPRHVIVAEGSWWASDLTKLDWQDAQVVARTGVSAAWDPQLVFETHHYGPAADVVGREALAKRLGVPLILGEYGESDAANLRAIRDWARRTTVGDFVWSFKKPIHDRALWTIPSTADYDTLRAAVLSGGRVSDLTYEGVLAYARDNVRNPHPQLVWNAAFYEAVKP
jgi:endoglucanase